MEEQELDIDMKKVKEIAIIAGFIILGMLLGFGLGYYTGFDNAVTQRDKEIEDHCYCDYSVYRPTPSLIEPFFIDSEIS